MSRLLTIDEAAQIDGHLRVFVTADFTTWPDDDGEPTVEHGWVDWTWSRTVLHDSSNDVSPLVECSTRDVDPDDEDRATWRDVIVETWREGLRQVGDVSSDGHEGWYTVVADDMDLDGVSRVHHLHVRLKHYDYDDGRGWVEDHIVGLPKTARKDG